MAAHSRLEHSLLIGRSFLSRRDPSARLTSRAKPPVSSPGMSSHLGCRKCQGDPVRDLLVLLLLCLDLNPHPDTDLDDFLEKNLVGIGVMKPYIILKNKTKGEVENMQIRSINLKFV